MSIRLLLSIVLLVLAPLTVSAQEEETVTGVVTSVNRDRETVTIRNDATGKRRAYFIDSDTSLTSRGVPIALANLRRGNKVTLRFRTTDRGREVITLRMPNPEDLIEVIPVQFTEEYRLEGTITGIRYGARTVTVRDQATRERLTFKVSEDTPIESKGRGIRFRDLQKGDKIAARYRETDEGLMLVFGRAAPAPAPVAQPVASSAPPQAPVLPKTASPIFLLAGLAGLSALLGLGLRQRRLVRTRR